MSKKKMFFIGSGGLDPDYIAFINATGITDATQQGAILQLITDYKDNGLWDKRDVIYPYLGGTAFTHKFNLKDPRDSDDAYRLSFLGGGFVHSSTGTKPNGTTSYADTFYTKPLSGIMNMGFYSRTNNATTGYDISAIDTGAGGYNLLQLTTSNNIVIFSNSVVNSQLSFASVGTSAGWLVGQFTGLTVEGFLNGVQKTAPLTFFSSAQPSKAFQMHRDSYDNATPSSQYSSKEVAFAVFGSESLTPTEVQNEYNIIQTYQTLLSRNI